jgi:hypothetical protein
MAETGDLIIKIGGDASKFKATIADVENSLKSFKANLGTTGLNIKIEALGFQEAKSNIKGVADFAEGTLGAIKNTIKEVKAERLTISADPNSLAPFNIKLNELNTTVKELEKAGILKNVPQEAAVATNSLQGLTNKLNELRKQRAIIDPDTNARAILQINQQIDKLQQKIVNLNNLGQKIDTGAGLGGGFNGISKGSAEAGRALTSLSLIAQDLPFGFIAIQNNLPAVIQTFGQLKATSQGTIPALQAIGGAILGPAGLFFAFSAVTSVLTVAVQKYGSLGGAIDAYLGKQFELSDEIRESTKAFAEFNKERKSAIDLSNQQVASIAGETTKIQALFYEIIDQTKSYQERNTALTQLKDIDKVYFGNLDLEKTKYEDLQLAVDDYVKKLKQAAITKGFQSELSTLSVELSKQEAQLNKVNEALDAAKRAPVVIRGIEARVDTRAIDAATEAYNKQKIIVDQLKASIDRIETALGKSVESEISITAPYEERFRKLKEAEKLEKKLSKPKGTRAQIFAPQIDSQALDEAFNLDKIIANLTKYGNVLIDVNKTEAERKNALRELSEINPEYFNQFKIGKSSVSDAKVKIEDFIRALLVQKKAQEDALAAAKLNNQFRENEEKGITAVGDKYRILNDEVSTLPKTFKDVEDAYKNANLNIDKIFKPDFSKLDTSFDFDQLSKGFKIIEEQSRKIKDNMVSALSVIQGLLQDTFLQLFDEGKGNWKEFGDAAVKEIKRITAALAVKALVEGLANLLTAGISGTVQSVAKGLEGIDTASLGEWLDMTPGAANFGGIRGNDGVNMSGQVVMTLRGTDLVGAMNRTNTSINRVG